MTTDVCFRRGVLAVGANRRPQGSRHLTGHTLGERRPSSNPPPPARRGCPGAESLGTSMPRQKPGTSAPAGGVLENRGHALPIDSHPWAAAAISSDVAGPDELLTPDQAGDYLRTGERFIRRLIAERRIPYVKLGKPSGYLMPPA
jgi:excisionase family DNA binding protein